MKKTSIFGKLAMGLFAGLLTLSMNTTQVHAQFSPEDITPANLPFEFNGVRNDINAANGIVHDGLGSDYSANGGPNTRLKFDGTGDYVVVAFTSAPQTLSFYYKANSGKNNFEGSSFLLESTQMNVPMPVL